MYVCMYVCMCVCMYVCMHVCMYVCVCAHVCVCMYVCVCECMYVCMYLCMYVCIGHKTTRVVKTCPPCMFDKLEDIKTYENPVIDLGKIAVWRHEHSILHSIMSKC